MGKKYKRELVTHLLFDYEGIEEHLEKMAARGWYLETPGNTIWKYRGAEPAEVKYAVTYVPKASQFDPEPNEEQRTLEEFCSTAGWEKVGDFLQAQIYMNRQPNPVAIETEDEVRCQHDGAHAPDQITHHRCQKKQEKIEDHSVSPFCRITMRMGVPSRPNTARI